MIDQFVFEAAPSLEATRKSGKKTLRSLCVGASRHAVVIALSDSKFASYQLVTRLARPRASYPSCVTAYPKPAWVSC